MNWFLKILIGKALDALEAQVTAYVKSTPAAWDDALAVEVFAFLRNFMNGDIAQQKAAMKALKDAKVEAHLTAK